MTSTIRCWLEGASWERISLWPSAGAAEAIRRAPTQ